jgi:phenylalanyl-tRNA synthetase beta chain
MKIPLSWLKDYININLGLEDLARTMTMVGLEVEEIHVVGLPMPEGQGRQEFKITGLSWDPEKFVVGQINEVNPHPDADRLVLCQLDDGSGEITVLTGAPNLFEYKGKGRLEQPLKVAYAKEGAVLYDGHKPGYELTKLKRTKIRGVESFSMVCSEKELGISDEHEGILILDADAPTGKPLAEYMGDAVFEVAILPNMIRDACMIGVARELSAVTGEPLKMPQRSVAVTGPAIEGKAFIQITDSTLNPRFVLGLLEGVKPQESPYWVQRRLRLAGMRPINTIVDATNYVMLETGQPLHAFDYDVLKERAGGKAPTIITRAAQDGEKLMTLDDIERTLDTNTILVTDTAGPLSLAGVMGGLESEVTSKTKNVLLEGANWNFINVRRTTSALHLNSEAGYRFARAIHPELAAWGVELGLDRMAAWGGGQIAQGLVDEYPAPVSDPVVSISEDEVTRKLGIPLTAAQISDILSRLEFTCTIDGSTVSAKTPPHRMDIGTGVIGKADLIEEIARIYNYDNIPETRLAAELPPQRNNPQLELEERVKDLMVAMGFQEVITYRLTSPEREARILPEGEGYTEKTYVSLANPIAPERSVMRQNLLASVLEILERNVRLDERLAIFEIGSIFLPVEGQVLPEESNRLAIAMSGKRFNFAWDLPESGELDFYDLKGVLENLLNHLQVKEYTFKPVSQPSYHPGKSAEVIVDGQSVATFGELHPRVKQQYDFLEPAVLVAEVDLPVLLSLVPLSFAINPVSVFPPVLEDIAVVVDEAVNADQLEALIRQTGGKLLADVQLFDVFRSSQIGEGKKSMAYSLTYQAQDHTLTAEESTTLRNKIIKRLERELGAKLRS